MTASSAQGSAAESMWMSACEALSVTAAAAAGGWRQLTEVAPGDDIWHSLTNCVAYQAGVWHDLLSKGMCDATQPAAFKLAIVLRHTPSDVSEKLLSDLLKEHSHCRDLTSYVVTLVTEDEGLSPGAGPEAGALAASPCGPAQSPCGPAPLRDLALFADCELAALAARPALYQRHAALVRHEYPNMGDRMYCELRIKVLNQLLQIPKLYHTKEFESLESTARVNIRRELDNLKGELLKYK